MTKFFKLFLAVMLVFCFVTVSLGKGKGTVRRNFGNCGLGSKWFGDKSGLTMHSLAATTNGYTGTFGVTTGTSGCEQFDGIVFESKRVEKYVAHNMDNLANDIAKGEGEYLTTLADIMEVEVKDRGVLFSLLQNNFDKIYTSDDIEADAVVKNIQTVVKG